MLAPVEVRRVVFCAGVWWAMVLGGTAVVLGLACMASDLIGEPLTLHELQSYRTYMAGTILAGLAGAVLALIAYLEGK